MSYAPTSTLPSSSQLFPHANLNQEVKLYKTTQQKQIIESLSEIYSILTILEIVEKSYIKDVLNDKDEYTTTVLRLINQYNILIKDESVAKEFVSLAEFTKRFELFVPLAVNRINVGVPVSIEKMTRQSGAKAVAETTGNFITCMDALKLNYNTKEQLHPLISELIININENFGDFNNKSKIINWLIKLNALNYNDELSSDEIKDFLIDLDTAYKGFYTSLE